MDRTDRDWNSIHKHMMYVGFEDDIKVVFKRYGIGEANRIHGELSMGLSSSWNRLESPITPSCLMVLMRRVWFLFLGSRVWRTGGWG